MRRRSVLRSIFLLSAAIIAAQLMPAQAADPVRIGFMASLTGLLAPTGKEMQEGFQFYFDQVGGQCGGRKVEIISEDDEGNPNTALTRLRKLIERDQIKVFAGIQWAHIGYALAPVIDKAQLPSLFMTTPDDLTQRRTAKFVTRVSAPASQLTQPLGEYAAKNLKYKRAVTIGMDNVFGYESVGGFQKVFEANGGQVIQKLWTPINVLDFAAYVSQIQSEADVVFSSYAGAPAVRFLKQYEESGLKQKIPLLATGMQVDESILRAGGDEATGTVNALYWSPTVDNRASKDFVAVFTAKYGKTPSVYHMSMYSGAHWICEALKAVESKGNDPELLQAAIRSASKTIEDPRGPMTLDDHQNPIQNIYIFRVEKRDGKLENRVIHTYPNVSQFWTYSPAEFLKSPPYSRDYPPLKAPQ